MKKVEFSPSHYLGSVAMVTVTKIELQGLITLFFSIKFSDYGNTSYCIETKSTLYPR